MTTKSKAFDEFSLDLAPLLADEPVYVSKTVANLFPTINQPYKIAICGEAPGDAEVHHEIPFCPIPTPNNRYAGASGRLLNEKLSHANIVRDACFIGNICQHRPPNNDISAFPREGEQIQGGLQQLHKDLVDFNPNICLLLGKTALWAAKGVDNIGDWRGSFFVGQREGPFLGRKCIATYHPAACLRQYEWTPLLFFDIKRALSEAYSPELVLPQRELLINLPYETLINELDTILLTKCEVSPDIEGYWNSLGCISLATTSNKSILVPFQNMDGTSYWNDEEQELQVWHRLAHILADPAIHKTWQNGLYDRFVLQYGFNVVTYGSADDTMLKFFEMWAELEKGLGFQNSILNKEPFYKFERKTGNRDVHFTYCCKDSATTYENNKRLDRLLEPAQQRHYQTNHQLLNPLLYMELRGIAYDTKKAKNRLAEAQSHIYSLQAKLDILGGINASHTLESISDLMCFKRDKTRPKKEYEEVYPEVRRLLSSTTPLTDKERGYINTACGTTLNIKSKDFKTYLYETLNLPKQWKEDPRTKEKKLTSDYEALLKLSRLSNHPSINLALQLGVLRTRAQMLEIHADGDKRIRCGYNIVGTETGRITCYTSPTGSGYNLQTIPGENTLLPVDHPLRKGMRDLFVADEGHYIFQCDLSGADGWTVGAYLAMLGDSTMLDDLKAGLKPARVVCFLLRHGTGALQGRSRADIKPLLEEVRKEDWDYFACKVGIWGTCYTMGPRKLQTVFLTQSEGKLDWDESKVRTFQQAVKSRYHLSLWHQWAQCELKKKPELTAPNGFKRRFFGRYNEILGEYLAHLPQVMTTYATNTAMSRLWNDTENRVSTSNSAMDTNTGTGTGTGTCPWYEQRLRAEPLHQVHDALLGQFKITDTHWAVDKIKSWFANPIRIAGQTITIPFEGSYGTNWALDEESKVGVI